MESSEIKYNVSPKLEISNSPVHGIGVFAKEQINQNEIIEVSRLLKLGWRLHYQHDNILRDYCWTPNCSCQECTIHGPSMYLGLGFASIYNHSDQPNTKTNFDYKNNTLIISANKDINAGEELFVSYGNNYWKSRSKNLTQK